MVQNWSYKWERNYIAEVVLEINTVETLHATSLRIYDMLGREVATLVNEEKQPGTYEVEFSASGLSSGIYFYRLQTGSFVKTKKMILLR